MDTRAPSDYTGRRVTQDTRYARRIDAHLHVWDLARRDVPWIDEARSAIRSTFAVSDWVQVADATDVDSAVLVQAINDADETDDLLAYAAVEPRVAGVVGWVGLAAPDVADRLAELRERPNGRWLVGIRHLALVDNDPAGWLGSPQVQRGLAAVAAAQLPYDLIFRPEHLDAVLFAVRSHPGLTFVLDHLGKPPTLPAGLDGWAVGMRALAAEPNVTCKLSQILTVAGPRRPYVDVALEAFGAERLLFGSDWPVSLLHAPYDVVVNVTEQLLARCSDKERYQIWGGVAASVYKLTSSPDPSG
jgi:L-fuconolactonase